VSRRDRRCRWPLTLRDTLERVTQPVGATGHTDTAAAA
jgi:hypothetical protein